MSFVLRLEPRKKAAGRFIGKVRDELIKAFLETKKEKGLNQRQLADQLGVDRARVTRALKGAENLTLRSVAEYASALDREIIFYLRKKDTRQVHASRSPVSEIGKVQSWGETTKGRAETPTLQTAV